MKHLLLSFTLVMFTSFAFATPPSSGDNSNTNYNDQAQMQGQLQGQDQTAIGLGFAKGGTGGTGIGHGGDANSNQSQSQTLIDSGNGYASAKGGSSDQHQGQNQQANNAGNAQQVNFNTPRQYHNTPSMPLFVPSPTATCMATIGGAGAGAGFGFSISGTYRSMHCEKVELAKSFNQMGQTEAALQVLCNVDSDHIDNVDLCDEVKARRAERVASKRASKELVADKLPKPQTVEADTNDEVAATSEGSGLFRFDPKTREWVFAGGSFFGKN